MIDWNLDPTELYRLARLRRKCAAYMLHVVCGLPFDQVAAAIGGVRKERITAGQARSLAYSYVRTMRARSLSGDEPFMRRLRASGSVPACSNMYASGAIAPEFWSEELPG